MESETLLECLVDAGRAPIDEWPGRYPGSQGMGYLCSYVPEEIVHAAGYTPVRIRGNTAHLRFVDAHLQSFTCALCRSTLDQALGGALNPLRGIIFAHTCDAMQALADLWSLELEPSHFFDVVMQPTNLGSPAAHSYLVAELERFRDNLGLFSGSPISEGDLRRSIAVCDETRRLVRDLQTMRHRLRVPDFYSVLDAAQVMPRDSFNPILTDFLRSLGRSEDSGETAPPAGTASASVRSSGVRLYLVGAVLDEPRLLDLIEDLGAFVAGDDLCSGSRRFVDSIGAEQAPIPALAGFYLRRTPCPTKLHPAHRPGEHLLAQARLTQADGIIFLVEKFCEPHAFDYATALPALDGAGVPHLLLEMEQTPSLEALRTRLQAFIEML
ncbi:2-hydroxyacyl-CoA dehydratase subunit D [Chloroflexota bacterium]